MEKDTAKPAATPRRGGMFGGPPQVGAPTEKAKDFKGTIKKLAKHLKPYWWQLVIVLVFVIGSTVFSILSPKILGNATNQIVDDYVSIKAYEAITAKLPADIRLPAGTTGADIIAKLPKGVDTVIGSQGTYVSGGEAQRLSIARAMLKNAPILILDEATAFADPDNEAKVQKAFTKLSAGKTVIMIAHRLSSVVEADRICVLKDGGIVEQGNHETLLAQGGLYAHMWEAYNKSVSWKVGKGEY